MKIEHITVHQVYYFKFTSKKMGKFGRSRGKVFIFLNHRDLKVKMIIFFEKLQIPSLYFKKLSAERKFEIKMVKKCLGPKMGKMVFDLDK